MENPNMPPVLIDLDGVLRLGKTPAPGLNEFLQFIKENQIKSAILSNTTMTTSDEIKDFFKRERIDIEIPVLTASDVTALYVKSRYKKAAVYALPKVTDLFDGYLEFENPKVIVMGDLGKAWTFEIINEIFRHAYNKIPVIAMQKNKFWKTPEDGLLLDLGAFVKAIEYAADTEALLIGKPSPHYFYEGLHAIGAKENDEFLMIGDDLENDINPVRELNGKGILIYTGKTSYPLPSGIKQRPDFEAQDLTDVIEILKNHS